jgi:hypothetical protein
MQNIADLEGKVFFECKNILDSLSKINNKDELLLKQDLFYELSERISFLKILEKNKESLIVEPIDIESTISTHELSENEMFLNESTNEDSNSFELEEVKFNNELNEISKEETKAESAKESEILDIDTQEEFVEDYQEELSEESNHQDAEIEDEEDVELPIAELLKNEEEPEKVEENEPTITKEPENRGKIVEFEKETPTENLDEKAFDTETKSENIKKINLVQIKGIKAIESLFDDDPLERIADNETPKLNAENEVVANKLVSENETKVANAKIEFRLDMNDKIAFSKNLFGGSQSEMNETINRLNSFTTLEQAKDYLSDVYYDRKWDKVDDYAQRLWLLVENKFL